MLNGGTSKWDILGARPAGDLSNLRTFVREVARRGIKLIFLEPNSKEPVDLRTTQMMDADNEAARQAAKEAGNPRWGEVRTRAGIQIATDDVKRLEKYADRAAKTFTKAPPNLATVPGDGLLVIDVDHAEGVVAFAESYKNATGETITPTVLTPGVQNADGSWKHKGGGHFYFELPEGYTLPDSVRSFSVGEGKTQWSIFPKDHYILIPPSVRPEGPYRWVGTVREAPAWLLEVVEEDADRRRKALEAKALRAAQRSAGGPSNVDSWAAVTDWTTLLEPDGWFFTGCRTACGCPEVTAPGTHASAKSATAHEPGCLETDTSSGHGPLHVWTDNPPDGVSAYMKSTGSSTLTKLQYVSWTKHGGDDGAAIKALGIMGGTIIKSSISELRMAAGLDETPAPTKSSGIASPRLSATPPPPRPYVAPAGVTDEDLDETPEGYVGVTPEEELDDATRQFQAMLPDNRHFDPYDTAVYPAGFHSDPELLRKIFDFSDVTRTIFHTARKRRPKAVHPMALLMHELQRRGARCPVEVRLWPGTSLSTFVAIAGRSGLGKSESSKTDATPWPKVAVAQWLEKRAARQVTLSKEEKETYMDRVAAGGAVQPLAQPAPAAQPAQPASNGSAGNGIASPSSPVLIPHGFDETTSLGSGQVLSDYLIEIIGKGENAIPVMLPHPVALISEDEMVTMLRAGKGESSTLIPTLNSAWAGMPLGNRTRMHGDRRVNGTYSVFITAGIQPKLCGELFRHDDSGFLQRWVFAGTADPYRHVNEPKIATPIVTPNGAMPTINPGDRFTADQRVIDEVEGTDLDYDLDHLGDEYAEMMSHARQVQIKLACLGALLHGSLHVSWELWEWTGWIMVHSHRIFAWLDQQAKAQERAKNADIGRGRAIQEVSKEAHTSSMTDETAIVILKVLKEAGPEGMSAGNISSKLGPKRREFRDRGLAHLQGGGAIFKDGFRYKLIEFKPA